MLPQSAKPLLASVFSSDTEIAEPIMCELADHLEMLRLHRIDSLYYKRLEQDSPIQTLYNMVLEIQTDRLAKIASAFQQNHLSPLLMKGFASQLKHFGEHALNIRFDLDLLTSPNEVNDVKNVLFSLGLRQGNLDREEVKLIPSDYADLLKSELSTGEVYPFCEVIRVPFNITHLPKSYITPPLWCREGNLYYHFSVDIHYSLHEVNILLLIDRSFYDSTYKMRFLSWTDQVWYIAARTYLELASENKKSLRDIAHLVAIISAENINWEDVISMSIAYTVNAPVYYTLKFISELRPLLIPKNVLETLQPIGITAKYDWGCQFYRFFDRRS